MNYIIEDNFDFWKELEDDTSICNDENICMIHLYIILIKN